MATGQEDDGLPVPAPVDKLQQNNINTYYRRQRVRK